MSKTLKTVIRIGGKLDKSLRAAFEAVEKKSKAIDKAFTVTKKVGVATFKAIAASTAAVVTGLTAVAESTREYRKDLAKMYNNAEMAGVATAEAFSGLENLYAMSGEFDSANEAMSNLLATGYKGKDLTKIIEAINGATVKWQDTITQESLADAINETVMSGKSVGQFDEILARSGVNLDTFNDGLLNCRGLAERQQYVLSWLANSGLTEVNEAYQKQNASLVNAYKADLRYQNSMAKLGAVAEPLAAIFKGSLATAISYIAEKLEGVDFEKVAGYAEEFGRYGKQAFDAVWEALSKIDWDTTINALGVLLKAATNILSYVATAAPSILPILLNVALAITAIKTATMLVSGAQAAWNTVKAAGTAIQKISVAWANAHAIATNAHAVAIRLSTGAIVTQNGVITKATFLQKAWNLVMQMNPIGLIITAIVALIAIFVTLYNKCSWFKEGWDKIWNGIKETVMTIWNSIQEVFNAIGDFFSTIFGGSSKKTVDINVNGEAAKNATGGTYSSPLLTWVAEAGGTETIVPHNNKPRSRALALEAVKGTGLNVGGNSFVFAPNISYNGGNTSELQSLLEAEFNRFKMQMEEWASNQRRVTY